MISLKHAPILLALLLAGCFETKLSLGPRDAAKIDAKYLGEWNVTWTDDGKTQSADVLVANFNGREYFVEWAPKDEKTARINAYTIDVKGATFVQLTGLTTDAELEEKHLIARLEMKDDKLLIRHLKEDFFTNVSSDQDLQKRVAENLDKAEMYGETYTGTKKAPN